MDTDASGHHHGLSVLRHVEAAETTLLTDVGVAAILYGRIPKVRASVDFSRVLHFGEEVDVRIAVAALG